jgi:UDP-N-acetylmuramoyl-tripeptide--D-alanyl-D-alanine ligase
MTLQDIAATTGGRVAGGADGSAVVTGDVVIDSRRVTPGSLFACVAGETFDGHDFATQAVAAGAVAALATREVDAPAVVVGNLEQALASLASDVIARVGARVVGVTGSSGKTSTKDLLAAVFRRAGETVWPENSFNNEIGLPVTVLRVTQQTQTLVLEYSARGVGHIRYLCGIVPPQLALVLNVGAAHLGEFGSREAIADAKGELVEALPPDGTAVLNADDQLVSAMRTRTAARVVTFGAGPAADVRVERVVLDELARPSFRLHTYAGSADVRMRLPGAHQALNTAAVVAAALAADVPLEAAVDAIEATDRISAHRMHLQERSDGLLVLDDAYNANPDSVRAAVDAVRRLASGGRRTWAVLGPMRELGPDSERMHTETGAYAAEAGIDVLVLVGPDAKPLGEGWPRQLEHVDDADGAVALLRDHVRPDDIVLVKASNSERLWRVADALLADGAAG